MTVASGPVADDDLPPPDAGGVGNPFEALRVVGEVLDPLPRDDPGGDPMVRAGPGAGRDLGLGRRLVGRALDDPEAAGAQDAVHLAERGHLFRFLEQLVERRPEAEDAVECCRRVWQRRHRALVESDRHASSGGLAAGGAKQVRRDVEARDVVAELGQRDRDPAIAAADVEQSPRGRQQLAQRRDDLRVPFGLRPDGEPGGTERPVERAASLRRRAVARPGIPHAGSLAEEFRAIVEGDGGDLPSRRC